MQYVTYDKTTGELTGCYIQNIVQEHEDCFVEVEEAIANDWVHYKYDLENAELVWTEPVVAVPKVLSVTRRQARQALLIKGKLDAVPLAIAAIEDTVQRGMAQIEWEDSLTFERNRPMLIALAAAIGLDEDGLDALFTFANTL
jgi:hypothetical protein